MDGVEQYEVACVVNDFDDSNACSIVVPRTRRLVHFTDIDTTNGLLRRRFYLRSQCHHTCAFHPTDTLVWGEWGSPILEVFGYRGLHGGDTIVHDTIVHDTVDIAVPGLYDAMPEVYPNPASATLSVRLKDGGAPLRCDVCDLQGRLLISSGKETIDVSHLPQGTYLLKTVTPQGAFVTRFVIKR